MATDPGRPGPRYTHLPFLTWTLLGLLVLWSLVWFFFYRPSTEEQVQVASFARALERITDDYVEEVDRERLYRAAMKGMVTGLGDRYSAYLTPAQMQRLGEETKGEFGGIGVVLNLRDGKVLIDEVLADGPASGADVEPGDVITHVDEVDIASLPLDKVVFMIRGKVGTEVALQLLRPSTGQSLTLTLVRGVISVPNVQWEMLEDGIGLLHVATFDRDSAEEVRQGLTELQDEGAQGLILDLRSNTGGLVKQAILMCDLFLSEGLIVGLKGRDASVGPPVNAKPAVVLAEAIPVVVLVDRWTASAAEILAGALQAHQRATVVGIRTIGKGAVTSMMTLPDESGLLLTVSHYELAGGKAIEGNGVEPDVVVGEVPPVPKDLGAKEAREWALAQREKAREEQLEQAMRILKEALGQR